MRKMVRILSVFIMCILILSFSACKGIKKADSDDNSIIKNEKSMDLNGRTIVVSVQENMHPEVESTKYYTDSEYDKKYKKLLLERKSKVEKKFNCKIEWDKSYLASSNNKSSKNVKADILFCGSYGIDLMRLIMDKTIMPLDNYIDYNSETLNNEVQNCSLFKGKHYGISKDASRYSDSMLIYNKDLISKEGLPDPMEMQKNNQWTWDAFLDVLKATTKDINGDGVMDQWGFVHDNYQHVFTDCIITNGGSYIKDSNGQFQFGLDKPEVSKAIQFAEDLYKSYKVSPDIVSKPMNWQEVSKLFSSGKCAIKKYWGENSSDLGFKTGVVIFPKGPDADNYIQYTPSGDFYAVPSNVDNPEAVVAVMADLFTIYDKTKDEYISGDDIINTYVPKEYADTYKDASQNLTYTWFTDMKSQYGQILSSIYGDIALKGKSIDDAISPQKSTLDKMINSLNQSN